MTITPEQLKAARGALGITSSELGKLAKRSIPTVLRAESGRPVQEATMTILQTTLEGLGVVFDDQGGVKITTGVDRQEK